MHTAKLLKESNTDLRMPYLASIAFPATGHPSLARRDTKQLNKHVADEPSALPQSNQPDSKTPLTGSGVVGVSRLT